ncbi:MAG: hypothetical protein M1830_001244 [Pleopsidium flavum]|nr:MAG: hypothetical protein M1830_001244 [Pleopsidium flavum]
MRMSHLLWKLTGAFLATVLLNCFRVSATPAVNVALRASFTSAPYLLELLETAAEENSTCYFPLLDRIAEGYFGEATTDHELYTHFLRLLQDDGHITDTESLSTFQFALSIHSAAPRIQAHYQYYNTSVEPSLVAAEFTACPVWVHFDGKKYCSPELERAQQDVTKLKTPQELPFDRVLGNSSDAPLSVLYADITSPLFGPFHQTVSNTAKAGRTSYRIRYKPSTSSAGEPLVINGYGVELALKRTDYIVIDDREAEKSDKANEGVVSGSLVRDELADLKPLSTSELSNLGVKAASFVMSKEDPFDTLIKVSQDFPKYSSAISACNATTEFMTEFRENRNTFLPAGYNIMWINGVQVDARQINAFSLLEHLRRERKLINSLRGLGLTGPEAVRLLSHPAIAQSKVEDEPQRYDYRDAEEGADVIIWLNDLEKDQRYAGWPTSPTALLQRTYPGQLPTVRRDIHNLVIPLDLSDPKDIEMLVESLQGFVKRKVAIRIGLVPTMHTAGAMDQAKVVYHLLDTYGLSGMLAYLEASLLAREVSNPSRAIYDSTIKVRKLRRDRAAVSFRDVLASEESQNRLDAGQRYLSRLGADGEFPPIFINGVALPRNDNWLQGMSTRVNQDLQAIQRGVFDEVFQEDSWLPGYFLSQAAARRNALIVPEDESSVKFIDMSKLERDNKYVFEALPRLPSSESASKADWAHLMVIADVDSAEGSNLLLEAVKFREEQRGVEVVIVHNSAASSPSSYVSLSLSKLAVERDSDLEPGALKDILQQPRLPMAANASDIEDLSVPYWPAIQPLVRTLGLKAGEQGLMLNGRLIGPVPRSTSFTMRDFTQLLEFERTKRLKPAYTAIAALGLEDKIDKPHAMSKLSSLIALSTISDIPEGIYEAAPTLRMSAFDQWNTTHSAILAGDQDTGSIQIVTAIDPASEIAQRWLPILKVLSELGGVHLRLFMNPRERIQELPVKRFYRHVLAATPSFKEDGSLRSPTAHFEGLPKEALLNLAMDVPPSWLVAPKECTHDLDNIKLSSLKNGADIDAMFELEHILIEGHSRDVTTGPAPRGVQLVLGTEKDPHFADTIIMANLGYFQFKANPGFWKIELQAGRSQQIFNIDSIGSKGYSPQPGDESTEIALTSFQGKTLFPLLSRIPGQETEDVLEAGQKAGSAMGYLSKGFRLAESILSNVGLAKQKEHADINIFSVASGHLYERMLNIMMVSVMRHTKHTVKFWFIEQFLSPSFKDFIPTLAAEYNFSYEMVTYKWPHWLRAQKEKQREIWGYKILFLDVLFPLSLDKVIFVDADQIVRTDMHDLVMHDLQGAPYAFTPMCDSRAEMEGFRFWKQGYWKSFLRGLPYHISALYVVDLKRFRQIAAGDRLRQQYHQLSADPNSLSNLDQDLPNHMQMALPIHSLPQEWLWCETWCSDESLKDAKTIDLCNNPLTKEPKLERARRQVPEWTVYDEEIEALARRRRERREGEGDSLDGERAKRDHRKDEL